MKPVDELPEAIRRIAPIPYKGLFPRRVPISPLFGLRGPFSPGDTVSIRIPQFLRPSVKAGRFNIPNLKALDAAEDEVTAEGEVYQHPGLAGVVSERPPDVLYQVDIQVQSILDLTNGKILTELDTNVGELVGAWRPASPQAPTQILGLAAFDHGDIEGILYFSAPPAKNGIKKKCMVLFPDRLRPGSKVTLVDPYGTFKEEIAPR